MRGLTREALEGELKRLSTEAVDRLQKNATLPALASLYALSPLVSTLITELAEAVKDETRGPSSEVPPENGLYL